jgi:hypothetical protein
MMGAVLVGLRVPSGVIDDHGAVSLSAVDCGYSSALSSGIEGILD